MIRNLTTGRHPERLGSRRLGRTVQRLALVATGLAIAAGTAGYLAIQPRGLFEPEVQLQSEVYASARRHFRTKLLLAAPSPQREVFSLQAPSYVEVIEYRSDSLRLSAWLA